MESRDYLKVRMVIRGRVQGVGFRRYVFKQAQVMGISGWVRNNPDGSVETEAAGAGTTVQHFITAMHNGPFFARVDEVEEVSREALSQKPSGDFSIKHG
ncbi:MAG TPA: acylphosphatase [Candidatus Rifleibacterium sp.]|nr:acylphosphatase [Candidatus Rifleibacterium sp.]HPT46978.1 acylphosphatase [Candidatus Rifleibacterium sp.]